MPGISFFPRAALVAVFVSVVAACGSDATSAAPDTPPNGDATFVPSDAGAGDASASDTGMGAPGVPTTSSALSGWLRDRSYRAWVHESAPHPSTGPHARLVLTYLDPTLDSSLARGNAQHPVGAASVKEFIANGEVTGWAVSVKVAPDSNGGQGWYWYEVFSTAPGAAASQGVGNSVCTGCHATGRDFIRSPYPLQ